jgi:hypothetical protein
MHDARNKDIVKPATNSVDLRRFVDTVNNVCGTQLNAVQFEAVVHTTQSEFGQVIIGRNLLAVPMDSAVQTLVNVFIKHNDTLPDGQRLQDHQRRHFTGAQPSLKIADKLEQRQLKGAPEFVDKTNAHYAHLRDAKSLERTLHYKYTFSCKVKQRMEITWATSVIYDGPVDKLYTWSRKYIETKEKLPYITESEEIGKAKKDLIGLEANLALAFFKDVKVSFNTLSTSAHALLLESGFWDVVVIDEAAREHLAGIATVLGALRGRIGVVVWSGDHMQGEGIVVGKDANVGLKLLSRNVFAEVADITIKKLDNAMPLDVFTLNTCYRMSQALIDWSSQYCYGGVVKADRNTGYYNIPLRNTLKAYWAQRTRKDFRGKWEQIAIDVNTKAEIASGTTTLVNDGEARQLAWDIKDMLTYEPPASTNEVEYLRIRGSDMIVITNYAGQVSAIRKYLRQQFEDQAPVESEELDDVNVLLGTTNWVQGKEGNIAFYSTVVSNGGVRLAKKDHLGLGFVANIRNYNVSLTRQRLARYIYGNFKLLAQALKDSHAVTHRYGEIFAHVRHLQNSGYILSSEECAHWMQKREAPGAKDSFDKKLREMATFEGEPTDAPEPTNDSMLHSVDTRTSTTGIDKRHFQPMPSGINFAGARDAQGNLTSKKHKNRGKKHAAKRGEGPAGGPSGGSAAA